jgi:hypothetical protein
MAESVPFWWVALFVLLALGIGAGAIMYVGGQPFAVLADGFGTTAVPSSASA